MTAAACGVGNSYPSGAPDFTFGFHRGACCPVICVSLFHVIVLSFCLLSFDCSFCLTAWYLYIFYYFILLYIHKIYTYFFLWKQIIICIFRGKTSQTTMVIGLKSRRFGTLLTFPIITFALYCFWGRSDFLPFENLIQYPIDVDMPKLIKNTQRKQRN